MLTEISQQSADLFLLTKISQQSVFFFTNMLTEYMSVDYVSRFPAVTMESAEPVKYDAMTVSNQLRVLTEGAVYWSAEDIASWTADLLGKYQTQLGRRTLLLDELKDEGCVAGGVLLTASQCDQICKWESELVPASKVAELIDFAKRRVFADPLTADLLTADC